MNNRILIVTLSDKIDELSDYAYALAGSSDNETDIDEIVDGMQGTIVKIEQALSRLDGLEK